MKTTALAILAIVLFVSGCGQPVGKREGPDAAPKPPDGWVQKVNDVTIARVNAGSCRCTYTSGRHVKCRAYPDTIDCSAIVSFTDSSANETWKMNCMDSILIFDDGAFSYFYGTK